MGNSAEISALVSGLGGALIGAVGAWVAVLVQHSLTRQSLQRATKEAVAVEIEYIKAALMSIYKKPTINGYVEFPLSSDTSKLCPIYVGASNDVGTMELDSINAIVGFYASFLTMELSSLMINGREKICVSKNSISNIIELAEKALDKLK